MARIAPPSLTTAITATLAIVLVATAAPARAAEDPDRARAFQDHVAYVATFAIPVLAERCATLEADYLSRLAPLYFRFVNARQDQIERGRLLTLAELAPTQTLQAYREGVIASRLGALGSGSDAQKRRMCAGALDMLSGTVPQGEWPPRSPAPSAATAAPTP